MAAACAFCSFFAPFFITICIIYQAPGIGLYRVDGGFWCTDAPIDSIIYGLDEM